MNVRQVYFTSRSFLCILLMSLALQGCVGMLVGAAVDTTIEVAKLPFKVAGAAIDLAIPDKKDDEE